MPFMEIYRTKDGKWHTGDCPLLTAETRSGEHQTIGSTAKKPDPPKSQMCRKCWAFLFPANTPADDPRIYACDHCGRLRNKAEGGNIFTLCDDCWDKHYEKSNINIKEHTE